MAEDAAQPDLQHRVTTIIWAGLNAELLVVIVWGACRMTDAIGSLDTRSVCLRLLSGCILGVLWCVSTALYREWFARRPSSESRWFRAAGSDDKRRARASAIQASVTIAISLVYLTVLYWVLGVVGAIAVAVVWRVRATLMRRARVAPSWLAEALLSVSVVLAWAIFVWSVTFYVLRVYLALRTAIQAIALSALAIFQASICARLEPPSRPDGE